VVLAAVVCIAWGVQSPAIINQLPLSRMTRIKLTANYTTFADPEFRGWVNSYAVIDIPPLPAGMAITEIVKTGDTMCDTIYIELNGSFVGAIHTNNVFILGNGNTGRHDAFNFQLHSPIFIPPGTVAKLYTPYPQGVTLLPSFYFVGYPLNVGEF
jgi:hypothetical protein